MVAEAHRKPVLVINGNYQPIRTVTLRKAITMLFRDAAVVVSPPGGQNQLWQEMTWADWAAIQPREGEDRIRTQRFLFKIPEIIRIIGYSDLPSRNVKMSRRAVYRRDNETCQYCGIRPGTEELSIDHVIPRSQGGKTTWENVVIACIDCNRKKADKTPEQAKMKLRTKPAPPAYDILRGSRVRVDSWQHFLGDSFWLVPLAD